MLAQILRKNLEGDKQKDYDDIPLPIQSRVSPCDSSSASLSGTVKLDG